MENIQASNPSGLPKSTDVVIVGAGPTGLTLAIVLAKAGIPHVLIDKLPQGHNTSRAAVLHAHTLETLEGLGVTRALTERGLKVSQFSIRDQDRALLQLNFGELASRHPYLLMLPQDITEKVLRERLANLGGTIHRGVTAIAAEQDRDGARITVETDAGTETISARYVVGGDGMHSVIRGAAGVGFEGAAYEDSFILADVRMKWPLGQREVSLYFAPEGLVVVAPLPDGSYRVVATMANAPENPSIDDIQGMIDARGPNETRAVVEEIVWSSRFRIHHRLVKSYRNGRLLLMGDSAHVHSPAGGQGMNTGLVDAVVLGRLLTSVMRSDQPDSVLDSYHEMRHPAAEQVLELAGRLTNLATMQGTFRRGARNAVLSLLNLLPPAKRKLLMNLSGLSRKHLAETMKEPRHALAPAS